MPVSEAPTPVNTKPALHQHPVLQRVYAARHLASPDELTYALKHLHPFTALQGLEAACTHLYNAMKAGQSILIVGDFDADGATSCALAVSALNAMGAPSVDYLVPNRFEYGYGLTPEIVAVAAQRTPTPDVIVTVDNGISSIEGVVAAKALGMKVIITDHHLPGESLPAAEAIVNPNLKEDTFPSKHLAGVGVIFYVMLGLRATLREKGWFTSRGIAEPNMAHFLDLVALGTVADVVPLDYNNRILVSQGIKRLRNGHLRPGLVALLEVANRLPEQLVASDLGFAVAPRLNAAGRLQDMSLGIACLLTSSVDEARTMARQLDELNQARQAIEADMQRQAYQALDRLQDQYVNKPQSQALPWGVCLFDESWHQGVIGILAGRMKDKLKRPVAVFTQVDEADLKGSVRSVKGLSIRNVLDTIATRHPGLITKFGGHAMAAGLSLPRANYKTFSHAFNEEVYRILGDQLGQTTIETDGVLAPAELSLEVAKLIREGGPWGQGFPEPLFEGEFTIIDQRLVGQKHLRVVVKSATAHSSTDPRYHHPIEGIMFNVDTQVWPQHRCQAVHLIYALDVNYFQGIERPQLLIKQIEPI